MLVLPGFSPLSIMPQYSMIFSSSEVRSLIFYLGSCNIDYLHGVPLKPGSHDQLDALPRGAYR
jgi:hypothetical protein